MASHLNETLSSHSYVILSRELNPGPKNLFLWPVKFLMSRPASAALQEIFDVSRKNSRGDLPLDGVVNEKTVELGQQIQPGGQLFIITQLDDIWITANFKETQLKKMHPGQRVDIRVDAFGAKLHGYIESMPGATGSVEPIAAGKCDGKFRKGGAAVAGADPAESGRRSGASAATRNVRRAEGVVAVRELAGIEEAAGWEAA